jgi:hypothetical protein
MTRGREGVAGANIIRSKNFLLLVYYNTGGSIPTWRRLVVETSSDTISIASLWHLHRVNKPENLEKGFRMPCSSDGMLLTDTYRNVSAECGVSFLAECIIFERYMSFRPI